jgi:mannose/fructose/N-acetylgalactosamine-specific phosphotransferase system component IIC
MIEEIVKLSAISSVILLDKLCLFQLQFHRPFVICTILGYITGFTESGFITGMLWEFIWASEEPLGSSIPPDESAASALHFIVFCLLMNSGKYPQEIIYLTFFLIFPAGYVFSYLDSKTRSVNDYISSFAERTAGKSEKAYLLHLAGPVLFFTVYFISLFLFSWFYYSILCRMLASVSLNVNFLKDLRTIILVIAAGVLMNRFNWKYFHKRPA